MGQHIEFEVQLGIIALDRHVASQSVVVHLVPELPILFRYFYVRIVREAKVSVVMPHRGTFCIDGSASAPCPVELEANQVIADAMGPSIDLLTEEQR